MVNTSEEVSHLRSQHFSNGCNMPEFSANCKAYSFVSSVVDYDTCFQDSA